MTAVRLIPCLDIDCGRVVKGVNFIDIRDAGDPVDLAKFYDAEGADELVFLDITASHEGRPNVIGLAEKVAEQVFIPFTVGGGLRRLEDMRDVLAAGADKISLNSAAVADPGLVARAADKFGNQCVVVAIDARRSGAGWEVYTHGGRQPTGIDAVEWATRVTGLGAGEILLTSMDGDGTRQGYDNDLNRAVSESVPVPVIASGGAGCAAHMVDAVRIGRADAVLLAGILHDRETTIGSLKREMAEAGLTVRC
ncbi:MAG: imidazole glycerol phosphate synthase subunit HisF [Armatimonadetes bacterium]|nr:imidazole glycerol phosphate synthase subunit HisF [Armatimonadota bacterium]